MDRENDKDCCKGMHYHHGANAGGGAVYGLGFIGALIYYLQPAVTFTDFVIGILKAMVWPAFLIHKIFTILGM